MLSGHPVFAALLIVVGVVACILVLELSFFKGIKDLPQPDTPKPQYYPPIVKKDLREEVHPCTTCRYRKDRLNSGDYGCTWKCVGSSRRPNWTPGNPEVVDPTPEAPKVEPLEDRCPHH